MRTLLLTLTGRDQPGVTFALFSALEPFGVEVLDVEQVVIRGRLVLGVLVTAPADQERLQAAVTAVAASKGLDTEIRAHGPERDQARGRGRLHVTVLGSPLRPDAITGVAGRIAAAGGNIDRIERIARYPVTCIDMDVSGADPAALQSELAAEAVARRVDIAVQPSGLARRAKRLVVLDVDSTLVQGEVIEMLACRAGHADEVARVTGQAMAGELDFTTSLQHRVRLLAGLPVAALDEVRSELHLTPGARTLVRTLRRLGYRLGIVSGGFSQITEPLAADLGIDYCAANTLEVADGRLTGRLVGPVLDRVGKATALERFAREAGVPMSATIAIGDGANDLDMLARAGLGVAFNAKTVVREAADTTVNVPYLDTILYLIGITREEVEAADADDPPDA